jgi:hypothetical protein
VDDGLGRIIDRSRERDLAHVLNPEADAPGRGGRYRTFCVRTCDGYFFPMSPSSSESDFARDQQNCESACPGTEMRVYFRKDAGDDPSDMTSAADDLPYSELPSAFVYRNSASSVPQCGCKAGARPDFSVVSTAPASDSQPIAPSTQPTETSSSIVVMEPPKAPQKPADEEAVQRMLRQKAEAAAGKDRKVRVVGPVFLPDPEEAMDLQAPAPVPAP